MGYKDFLSETSKLNGNTLADRVKNELQSTWDKYFTEAPNKQTVEIDSIEEIVIIQHMRYGEDKYDNQLLLTQNTTEADYGKKVLWKSRYWLIINAEERAIDTHRSWKILLMQNNMVSKQNDGTIKTEPCHLETKSSRSDGNSKVTLIENSWVIRVQKNDLTLSYYENQRFIFDNKVVYKIVNLNYSEFENQVEITLEPTQKMEEDDFDNNIAYNKIEIDTTPEEGKNGVYFTSDKLEVQVGSTESIEVYEYLNNVIVPSETFTFRIDGIDSSKYTIVSQDGNSISIKCDDYYYSGTLVAIKDSDLSEYSIPLILSSPMG